MTGPAYSGVHGCRQRLRLGKCDACDEESRDWGADPERALCAGNSTCGRGESGIGETGN